MQNGRGCFKRNAVWENLTPFGVPFVTFGSWTSFSVEIRVRPIGKKWKSQDFVRWSGKNAGSTQSAKSQDYPLEDGEESQNIIRWWERENNKIWAVGAKWLITESDPLDEEGKSQNSIHWTKRQNYRIWAVAIAHKPSSYRDSWKNLLWKCIFENEAFGTHVEYVGNDKKFLKKEAIFELKKRPQKSVLSKFYNFCRWK